MLGTVDVVEPDPKLPKADLGASAGFDALPLAAGAPKLKPPVFGASAGVLLVVAGAPNEKPPVFGASLPDVGVLPAPNADLRSPAG